MPKPERLSALIAEKKPPTLQPKACIAPTPISRPPPVPLASSPRGGTRIANSRESSAAASPPNSTPRFRREPEESQGGMRSGRWTRPRPRRTQSPQLRRPSEAVHGRSKAKRKTLTVATRMAAPHTGQGRPKTAAYCPESAGPISGGSTRALHDEALHPLGLGPLDDRVPVASREGVEIGVGAGIGREHVQPPARWHVHDGLRQLHARPRAR